MVRYLTLIVVVFLIADHIYTHWGPQIINSVASHFMGKETKIVEEPPYKESVIDKGIKKIKDIIGR